MFFDEIQVRKINEPIPAVRSISDTTRWVAYFRARDAPTRLFRDPNAGRLAGERGFQIANTVPEGTSA
jgi:hypothetical protein